MHEEILATLLRSDEPVTLRIVQPLDGASCHRNTPPYLTLEPVRKAMGLPVPLLVCLSQCSYIRVECSVAEWGDGEKSAVRAAGQAHRAADLHAVRGFVRAERR